MRCRQFHPKTRRQVTGRTARPPTSRGWTGGAWFRPLRLASVGSDRGCPGKCPASAGAKPLTRDPFCQTMCRCRLKEAHRSLELELVQPPDPSGLIRAAGPARLAVRSWSSGLLRCRRGSDRFSSTTFPPFGTPTLGNGPGCQTMCRCRLKEAHRSLELELVQPPHPSGLIRAAGPARLAVRSWNSGLRCRRGSDRLSATTCPPFGTPTLVNGTKAI